MRLSLRASIGCVLLACAPACADELTITLTGQAMIRSDLRATAPATCPTQPESVDAMNQ